MAIMGATISTLEAVCLVFSWYDFGLWALGAARDQVGVGGVGLGDALEGGVEGSQLGFVRQLTAQVEGGDAEESAVHAVHAAHPTDGVRQAGHGLRTNTVRPRMSNYG